MTAAPISTRRLTLQPLSAPLLQALVDHDPGAAQAHATFPVPAEWLREPGPPFRLWLGRLLADASADRWLARAVLLEDSGEVIGLIGFHGPPGVNALHDPTAVEVGYGIDAAARRQGYAEESVRALIGWASAEEGIERFLASIAPTNEASLALAAKLGFVHVDTVWDDEDGEERVFGLSITPT